MNNETNVTPINEISNAVKYEAINIKTLIYTIRGKQVILDRDLAELYNCKNGTKTINQAVKRNIERFPERFMFQLSETEYNYLRSHIGTAKSNIKNKKFTLCFYRTGRSNASSNYKNRYSVDVSIKIMDAFVEMRKFISLNGQIFERLTNVEYKLLEHDNKFNQIFNELQNNKEQEFKQKIFFKGQIYDAYELIIDIIKIAKTDIFHDRFIIIDNKELYHCGASLKDLGKKCFGINKIEEIGFIENINKIINF